MIWVKDGEIVSELTPGAELFVSNEVYMGAVQGRADFRSLSSSLRAQCDDLSLQVNDLNIKAQRLTDAITSHNADQELNCGRFNRARESHCEPYRGRGMVCTNCPARDNTIDLAVALADSSEDKA